jgi:high-affinity iron transporter
MAQAFIIVLREGFEAFLIVATTAAYLRKTGRPQLLGAVRAGIAVSLLTSALFGYLMLRTSNEPLWEGVMGLISAAFIGGFVVHMWRMAPRLKEDMESRLAHQVAKAGAAAYAGVFLFTVFMITREGMETALLLIQVHSPNVVAGAFLGGAGAAATALAWNRLGHLINLKAFFQVTAVFLLLFVGQVLLYSFHELTEAGVFPNSEALHLATEPYSPDGVFGKWLSLGMVAVCGLWLVFAALKEKRLRPKVN